MYPADNVYTYVVLGTVYPADNVYTYVVLGTDICVYPADNVYTYVLVNLEAIPTLGSDIRTWNILPPPISLPGDSRGIF